MLKRILIVTLLTITSLLAQKRVEPQKLFSPYATAESRTRYRKALKYRAKQLLENKSLTVKEKNAILDELALMLYRPNGLYDFLKQSLNNFQNNEEELNIHLLETLKALYPDSLTEIAREIVTQTNSIPVFIYAACHLLHYPEMRDKSFVDSLIQVRFQTLDNFALELFRKEINRQQKSIKKFLPTILSSPYQKGKTIIFSLQRKDRTYPGLTIIRAPNGKFVRTDEGKIFSIPQLALSIANLPGYLRNGNTPEGIFSIVGFYITQKESIGPTPIILTRIPFGKPPKIFFHGENKFDKWDIRDYRNLIPPPLRNYEPFYETFYAGKLGRRLLVMHGSTDDLAFYKNEKYFPLTPTRGCLSAVEIWDSTGHVIRSDQAKLANAFFSTNQLEGFLVVLNIDNSKKPVTLNGLLPYIKKAEELIERKPKRIK